MMTTRRVALTSLVVMGLVVAGTSLTGCAKWSGCNVYLHRFDSTLYVGFGATTVLNVHGATYATSPCPGTPDTGSTPAAAWMWEPHVANRTGYWQATVSPNENVGLPGTSPYIDHIDTLTEFTTILRVDTFVGIRNTAGLGCCDQVRAKISWARNGFDGYYTIAWYVNGNFAGETRAGESSSRICYAGHTIVRGPC